MYKTAIINYTPSSTKRAQKIEKKINEMTNNGYEFVSICSTPNCGTILVFKTN